MVSSNMFNILVSSHVSPCQNDSSQSWIGGGGKDTTHGIGQILESGHVHIKVIEGHTSILLGSGKRHHYLHRSGPQRNFLSLRLLPIMCWSFIIIQSQRHLAITDLQQILWTDPLASRHPCQVVCRVTKFSVSSLEGEIISVQPLALNIQTPDPEIIGTFTHLFRLTGDLQQGMFGRCTCRNGHEFNMARLEQIIFCTICSGNVRVALCRCLIGNGGCIWIRSGGGQSCRCCGTDDLVECILVLATQFLLFLHNHPSKSYKLASWLWGCSSAKWHRTCTELPFGTLHGTPLRSWMP